MNRWSDRAHTFYLQACFPNVFPPRSFGVEVKESETKRKEVRPVSKMLDENHLSALFQMRLLSRNSLLRRPGARTSCAANKRKTLSRSPAGNGR